MKTFLKFAAPFLLIGLALTIVGLGGSAALYRIAGTLGMAGVVFGLSRQAWKHYQEGRVGVHWSVNFLFGSAMLFRGCYLFTTGQYLLALPDAIGVMMCTIIHFQFFGYCLKKQGQ